MLDLCSSTRSIIWSAGIEFGYVNVLLFMLALWSMTGYIRWSAYIGSYGVVAEQYQMHSMECMYLFWIVNILVFMLELWSSTVYILWSNTGYIIWHTCICSDVEVVDQYRIHNMDCMCLLCSC